MNIVIFSFLSIFSILVGIILAVRQNSRERRSIKKLDQALLENNQIVESILKNSVIDTYSELFSISEQELLKYNYRKVNELDLYSKKHIEALYEFYITNTFGVISIIHSDNDNLIEIENPVNKEYIRRPLQSAIRDIDLDYKLRSTGFAYS
ncbi:MAG: hypothetical protein IH964_10140 [Candidatus Dadabacteria bacterium]|nr:hypothetical protein [Candidatus Dadabacteria bacterium]